MNSSNMAIPVGLDLGTMNTRIAILDTEKESARNGSSPIATEARIVNTVDGDRFTLSICKILPKDDEHPHEQILVGQACRKWCDRNKVSTEVVSIHNLCKNSENGNKEEKAVVAFFGNLRQIVCDATSVDTSLTSTGYTLFPVISIPDTVIASYSDTDKHQILENGVYKAVTKGFCITPAAALGSKQKKSKNNSNQRSEKQGKKRIPSHHKFSLISNAAAVCVAHGLTEYNTESLSNGNEQAEPPKNWNKVLVVNWGASGLTLSSIKRTSPLNSILEVLDVKTESSCGGNAIVRLVMNHCATIFHQKHRIDYLMDSKKSVAKLRLACEEAIRTLCRASTAHIMIDGLIEGIDLNMSISKPRFEMLCSR